MDAYAQATNTLTNFFRDDTQRVFALKGSWGVGKSHFIREDYLNRQKRVIPKYVAYVSLFGVRTTQEIRESINYSLTVKNGSPVVTTGLKLAGSVKPKASAGGAVLDLADLTARTFWYLAKTKGVLIVLDDLERAHKDLGMDQILGLASSLTENTEVKVLLILNEKRLSSGEADEVLLKYREKVIDVEHTFAPEPRQLVSRYLAETNLVEVVLTCLKASEGTNIRLIFKINRALAYFRETAHAHNIRHDDEDLAQMAKVVWLYHVSPVPLTQQLLTDAWMNNFLDRSDAEGVPEAERALYQLASRVELSMGRFNELTLEYLFDGYFSESGIQKAVRDRMSEAEKAEMDRRVRAAFAPYAYNFRATESDVVEPVERLLDDYAEKMSADQMIGYTKFLEMFKVPTAKWWRAHVGAVASKLTPAERNEYLINVPDEEAQETIRGHSPQTRLPADPWEAFLAMARTNHWYEERITALAEQSEEYFVRKFKDEDTDFLEDVRGALRFFAGQSKRESGKILYEKLVAALQKIAGENHLADCRSTASWLIKRLRHPSTAPRNPLS